MDLLNAATGLDHEVRHGVDWATYCRLRDPEENNPIRMTYLDGTLVLSRRGRHAISSRRLLCLVTELAVAWRLPFLMIGSTTLRLEGGAGLPAAGKEPAEGFYLGPDVEAVVRNTELDLLVDPAPNLAIEIDNPVDADLLPRIYARLGVPEVWIYRAEDRSLRFLKLDAGRYDEVDRSPGMPRLTSALAMVALAARDEGMGDLEWRRWLKTWASALPASPA